MFLGVITQEEGNQTIHRIRDLTREELAAFDDAVKVYNAYLRYKFAPQMVYGNDADFFSSLEHCLRDFNSKPRSSPLGRYTSVANRMIANYLSSMSFFLNFTHRRLGKTFGADSNEQVRFKNATSAAYDGSFPYRFMSKLRNYVQHCDHAIGVVTISHSEEDAGGPSLNIFCDTATLLEDRHNWGKSVASELDEIEQIDLVAMVKEVTPQLYVLDELATSMLVPGLAAAGRTLRDLLGDTLSLGYPMVGELEHSGEEMVGFSYHHFPLEEMHNQGLL